MKQVVYTFLFFFSFFAHHTSLKGQEFNQAGKIMLKVRSSDFHLHTPKSENLRKILLQYQAQWKQLFPHSEPKPGEKSRSGLPLVDVSLIYEVTLSDTNKTKSFIRILNCLHEIAYAEPKSYYPPLFQPNDIHADSLKRGQATFLKMMKAYQAWGLYQGDTNITIGVLDTGCKWDHEDFISNIRYNINDSINGIDDDSNGWIDDFRGWDFSSNDNDPKPEFLSIAGGHGNQVCGQATATTHNAKGVASLGFKCRLLPLKVYNFNGSQFSNFTGFEGIVYAANMGCNVINLSWGSARNGLQYEQDIISYASINKDVVVVAAAGNTPQELNFMPASYKHVLSVAAIDSFDRRSSAGTYSRAIDLAAPGVQVWGLDYRGGYFYTQSGSSIASPIAASGAGLTRGRFPDLNALQIAEFMKVNSDVIDSVPANRNFAGKLGKGRINALKLMIGQNTTSIRLDQVKVKSQKGAQFLAGDTVFVWPSFINYLDPVDSFRVQFGIENETYSILQSEARFGSTATMQVVHTESPLVFVIPESVTSNRFINLVFTIATAGFSDKEYHRMVINSEYLDLDTNRLRLSITSNGRFGYLNDAQTIGSGIQLDGKQMSSSGGWMIGFNQRKLSNSVFGIGSSNNHFKPLKGVRYLSHPLLHQHAVGYFNDSLARDSSLGIHVKQSAYSLNIDSINSVAFIQLQMQNLSNQTWDSLCVGLYTDFEVRNLFKNKINYDSVLRLGYTWSSEFPKAYAGMVLLTDQEVGFFAIDAIASNANGNINLTDGFSKREKWQSISNGLARLEAGTGSANGNNVVQIQSAKLRNFGPQTGRRVAFAYLLSDSLEGLKKQAKAAKNFYQKLNTSPKPDLPAVIKACEGDSIELFPNNGTSFLFEPIGDIPVIIPARSIKVKVNADTIGFWVSCSDSLYDSQKVKVLILRSNPMAGFSAEPDSVIINNSPIAQFTASQIGGDLKWYVNDTLQASSPTFIYSFLRPGNYRICLAKADSVGCTDSVCLDYRANLRVETQKKLTPKPMQIRPNPAEKLIEIMLDEEVLKFTIINQQGREVKEITGAKKNYHKIDISDLPSGLYLLKAQLADDRFGIIKWFKN